MTAPEETEPASNSELAVLANTIQESIRQMKDSGVSSYRILAAVAKVYEMEMK